MSERDEIKGLMIEDHDTTTHTLLERIAEGKGLECRIITRWDRTGKLPEELADNRFRLVIYSVNFDRDKHQFTIDGYLFGDLPIGLKCGRYQMVFNRLTICEDLPEEMFDDDDMTSVRPSELCDPVQL